MRTVGTFQDVYTAAQSHYINEDDVYGGRPMDAVIRKEGEKWMLESAIEKENEDCSFSCSLEDFDNYWYELYKDIFYLPSDSEVADFVEIMGGYKENFSKETGE